MFIGKSLFACTNNPSVRRKGPYVTDDTAGPHEVETFEIRTLSDATSRTVTFRHKTPFRFLAKRRAGGKASSFTRANTYRESALTFRGVELPSEYEANRPFRNLRNLL